MGSESRKASGMRKMTETPQLNLTVKSKAVL